MESKNDAGGQPYTLYLSQIGRANSANWKVSSSLVAWGPSRDLLERKLIIIKIDKNLILKGR